MTTDTVARWRTDGLSFLEDVLTLPDRRSYGASLDGWQRDDFAAAFGGQHVWWERPRGCSKTMDAAAFALHHMLSAQGRRIYFAAVDRDQAALAHDSLRSFISRSPLLREALKVDRWKITARSTDSTLEVLAADAASSWGLRPSLVIADELSQWRGEPAEELFYSLYSALGKVPGARMMIVTTAGWDRTSLCWKLREQVKDDPAWVFSRIGQCASWVSPDFLEQQRRLLPEHVYRRLHENQWVESGGAYLTYAEVERIFAGERVMECQSGAHYLGLDVGLSGAATAACVLHREGDGVVVHDFATWQGTQAAKVRLADVEEWIKDAAVRRYSGAVLAADPWQAVSTLQRLRDVGVRCEEATFTQQYRGHLFQNLLELVRGQNLKCFPHEVLKDELLALEFREIGGNLRVDHPSGGRDDHAVALAVAASAAVQAAGKGLIYPFSEANVTEDADYQPGTGYVWVAYKWGYTDPAHICLVQQRGDVFYQFDELVGTGRTEGEWVADIVSRIVALPGYNGPTPEEWEKVWAGKNPWPKPWPEVWPEAVGDPDGTQFRMELKERGIGAAHPDNVRHDAEQGEGVLRGAISSRRLRLHPRCVETIRALQNLRASEQAAGCDALRFLMWRLRWSLGLSRRNQQ